MENYRRIFPRNFNMASNNLDVPSGGTPRPDRTNEFGDGLQKRMSNARADDGPNLTVRQVKILGRSR